MECSTVYSVECSIIYSYGMFDRILLSNVRSYTLMECSIIYSMECSIIYAMECSIIYSYGMFDRILLWNVRSYTLMECSIIYSYGMFDYILYGMFDYILYGMFDRVYVLQSCVTASLCWMAGGLWQAEMATATDTGKTKMSNVRQNQSV